MTVLAVPPAAAFAATVAAVTRTITLGSILVGVVVGVATLVALVYGIRYKVSYEAASSAAAELRAALADERERHEQASAERRDALAVIADQKEVIARLEALPNLAVVVNLMSETFERIDAHSVARLNAGLARIDTLVDEHDRRAQARHTEILAALKEARR